MTPGNAAESALSEPFVRALRVSGAAISTIGGLHEARMISASDDVAARVDEVQLEVGEGPCWDALDRVGWVDAPALSAPGEDRWPAFREAIRSQPIGALFAFPLRLGGLQLGTVDLYNRDPGELPQESKRVAEELATRAASALLRTTLVGVGIQLDDDAADAPRTIVHQATGMVIAQLGGTPDDALLVLRGRAFATGRPLRDVARDVVERRLDFSSDDGEH